MSGNIEAYISTEMREILVVVMQWCSTKYLSSGDRIEDPIINDVYYIKEFERLQCCPHFI